MQGSAVTGAAGISPAQRPAVIVSVCPPAVPAAQTMWVDGTAAIAASESYSGSGLGVVTRAHAVPFQRATFNTEQLPLYVILEPQLDGQVQVIGVYDEGRINNEAAFADFLKNPEGK